MPGRRLGLSAVALVAAATTVVLAQRPLPALTTIALRRNVSDSTFRNMEIRPGGRLAVTNTSLRIMLRNIERLQEYQLVGGPDWMATDRWDIVAVADGEVSEIQAAQMLKAFLVERFKLKMHAEKREVPVYSLVVARTDRMLGPDLRPSAVDCATSKGVCGDRSAPGEMHAVGRPIANVLRLLERVSGRMVLDRTGLTGAYDFSLRWRPDDLQEVNAGLPSFFTAIEEQLGLRLQPDRAPIDVLVIDSAERPVED